jgi:plasmid stability protein
MDMITGHRKLKIGTVVDERLFRRLRIFAAKEGRSISDIIQESLQSYLQTRESGIEERMAAFERVTANPFRLSDTQFRELLEEEEFDR